MKKIIKFLFVICLLMSGSTLGAVGYFDAQIGESYSVSAGSELILGDGSTLVCNKSDNTVSVGKNGSSSVGGYQAKVSLFGIVPIKSVNVTETDQAEVVVLGSPFGIRMYTEGVLVVGYSDVETENGFKNPAKDAGIKSGDIILSINGVSVDSNTDVQKLIKQRKNNLTEFLIKRDGKEFTVALTPVLSKTDGFYKIGIWIRDSSAGIGTLTFYSPTLDVTAGLGHGICDADTGDLVPFEKGDFVKAEIVGIKKATNEVTGELQGIFSGGELAEIADNDITGVYGCDCDGIDGQNVMSIARKQEIKAGKAQILTTIDGEGPKLYDCKITKVYHNDSSKIKNMVVEITGQQLLNKTGGIVQGMSGSPIIQNGKLIGAVTHVLVDDPTKGYAIFAENMLETAQSVADEQLKDAS